MTYMVAYLSDAYLREIADYYAGLRPPYPAAGYGRAEGGARAGRELVDRRRSGARDSRLRRLPRQGAHRPGARDPRRWSGCNRDYIAAQMGSWKVRACETRESPDCMAEIANGSPPEDIAAVTAWLAAQRASPDTPPAPAGSLKLPIECGGVQ